VAGAQKLWERWQQGEIVLNRTGRDHGDPKLLDQPGRPLAPRLVHPRELPRRNVTTADGRAALLHAIAHIEFNAIHLALDACYRFRDMPDGFYADWLSVAAEEALHFSLLRAALVRRGFDYGAFAAHNGLWEMAAKTRHDVLVRMALVPRVLEARGLDATPEIRSRFAAVKDQEAVSVLDRILADEVRHVAIGNEWYRSLCRARGMDPSATFAALCVEFDAPRLQLPLNRSARLRAGFTEDEIAAMEIAAGRRTAEGTKAAD